MRKKSPHKTDIVNTTIKKSSATNLCTGISLLEVARKETKLRQFQMQPGMTKNFRLRKPQSTNASPISKSRQANSLWYQPDTKEQESTVQNIEKEWEELKRTLGTGTRKKAAQKKAKAELEEINIDLDCDDDSISRINKIKVFDNVPLINHIKKSAQTVPHSPIRSYKPDPENVSSDNSAMEHPSVIQGKTLVAKSRCPEITIEGKPEMPHKGLTPATHSIGILKINLESLIRAEHKPFGKNQSELTTSSKEQGRKAASVCKAVKEVKTPQRIKSPRIFPYGSKFQHRKSSTFTTLPLDVALSKTNAVINSRNQSSKQTLKPEKYPLEPLNEEDELSITAKIISNDIREVEEGIQSALAKGISGGPFKRLYEAAQAKILANAEFEKAKAEIFKQIRSTKVSPRKTNTLSTAGTGCNGEFQRSESNIRDYKRKAKGKQSVKIGELNEQRKRAISIIK